VAGLTGEIDKNSRVIRAQAWIPALSCRGRYGRPSITQLL
jgi:hypothetical protein